MTLAEYLVDPSISKITKYLKTWMPHKHYKKTTQLSSDYVAFVTGEGLDKMLRRVVRRESEELFEQRKQLTVSTIPCIIGRVLDVFRKVQRTSYKKKIEIKSKDGAIDETKTAELKKIISSFHGGRPLDKYLFERVLDFGSIDPNGFIVIEWDEFDGRYEYAKPYPFEVPSENVIEYSYKNGVLKMLMVKGVYFNKLAKEMPKYTVYLENQTIIYKQISDPLLGKDYPASKGMKDGDYLETENGVILHCINRKYYTVEMPDAHDLGVVPAIRVGYIPNLSDKKETLVSNFHKAVPLLKKTIKNESESDLTHSLSAFPLPISYRDPCNAQGCVNGTLADGKTCGTCAGTGFVRSSSIQEEIIFRKPKSANDAFRLSEMFHFVAPPVDLLRYMDEYLDGLSRKAISTVFNSDVFSRQEIADTATGKNISLQNVYDNLVQLADHIAWVWWVFVDIIGRVTDITKGMEIEHELVFSKDFKLKGLSDILDELKQATDSGASPNAIESLQKELMRILLSDEEYARFELASVFNPFTGLNDEQIALAVNSNYTSLASKVLYFNLNNILKKLEREIADFYSSDYAAQKKAIDAEVERLIAEIGKPEIPLMQ